MEPIRGKDAYIEFQKAGGFKKYGCVKYFAFEGDMTLVGTKTEGDSYYAAFRGKRISWTISLDGLMIFDDVNWVNQTTLREYWKQMVPVSFQIIFTSAGQIVDGIAGSAYVVKPAFSVDTAFGRASYQLQGTGEPKFGVPPTCTKEITSHSLTRIGASFLYSVKIFALNSGTVPSYDWRIDGGEINTELSTGWTINAAEYHTAFGNHVLEIWPVCANGVRGVKKTINFTVPFG